MHALDVESAKPQRAHHALQPPEDWPRTRRLFFALGCLILISGAVTTATVLEATRREVGEVSSLRGAQALRASAAATLLASNYTRLHPAYHITAESGWLNDPNGLLFWKGLYHVFYQASSNGGPVPYKQAWGHVVSKDLVHWKRLEFALLPDQPYDADGCWTGAITVVNGAPRLLYTCVSEFSPPDSFVQNQCGASPADVADPELRVWVKDASNPLTSFAIPSPGGTRLQWRDPTAGLHLPGGAWLVVIGAQVGCRGAAAVYTSPDFANWTYDGLLSEQDSSAGLPTLDACSQFGDAPGRGLMWECPGLFPLGNDGRYVFKYGDQQAKRARFASDFYQVGTLASSPDAGYTFVPSGPAPKNIDGGAVYASQAMDAGGGRRVLFAWAMETPATPVRGWQGALTLPRQLGLTADGRHVTESPVAELASLRSPQQPVFASGRVRLVSGAAGSGAVIGGGGGGRSGPAAALASSPAQPPPHAAPGAFLLLPLPPSPSAGTQREVELIFTCDAASASDGCEVGIAITTGGASSPPFPAGPHTAVLLRVPSTHLSQSSANASSSPPSSNESSVAVLSVNRAATGGAGDAATQKVAWGHTPPRGGSGAAAAAAAALAPAPAPAPAPSTDASASGATSSSSDAATAAPHALRVFVDHSVVEAYAGGGRGVVTSRVYPDFVPGDGEGGDPSWGVALLATRGAANCNVRVWELGSAWA